MMAIMEIYVITTIIPIMTSEFLPASPIHNAHRLKRLLIPGLNTYDIQIARHTATIFILPIPANNVDAT